MNILRINLHIHSAVYPDLVNAIEGLAGKTRAEMIRKLANFGLQQLRSQRCTSNATCHDEIEFINTEAAQSNDTSSDIDYSADLDALLGGMSK